MALSFCKQFKQLSLLCSEQFFPTMILSRNRMGPPVKKLVGFDQPDLPKPGGKFWRKVHFPENYTVKPLEVTRLGGRDPESGRKINKRVGGGLKYKYLWVHHKRVGPEEGPPLEEKVMQIVDSWCHTAKLALISSGKEMKYYFATENMKPGDVIKTSMHIPRIAVNPNEGDAYPLGALPMGTKVHSVERIKGTGGFYAHAAGVHATILRKMDDKIVVQLPSKQEVALPRENMCVVGTSRTFRYHAIRKIIADQLKREKFEVYEEVMGMEDSGSIRRSRLSNIEHGKTHIGSPNRLRELGYRPRSGLFQKKTGRFGRRIYALPPVKVVPQEVVAEPEYINLTLNVSKKHPLVI